MKKVKKTLAELALGKSRVEKNLILTKVKGGAIRRRYI